MTPRNPDEWTVERWRLEPRPRTLAEPDDWPPVEVAPPLWKDLAAAGIAAALLWGAALVLFG